MPEILIYRIHVLLIVSESFLTIESKVAVFSKNKAQGDVGVPSRTPLSHDFF